ncbi:MAG: tetratricopeptide repeat protein [Burkholderiales bacterium]|nr:tetratricopeptide repeat protein [Burkholderiales bacterium]
MSVIPVPSASSLGELLDRARAAIEARRYADADALASALLDQQSDCAEAWLLRGLAAEGIGDYDSAETYLARAAERIFNTGIAVRLASCRWRLGRLDAALNCIEHARASGALDAELSLVHATVLHGMGRFAEARQAAEEGLRLAPDSALLAARLGATLMRLGLTDEARVQFVRAAKLSPALAHCGSIRVDREAWAALIKAAAEIETQAHIVHEAAAQSQAKYVVMVACDSVYLNRYGAAFLRSFARNAGPRARLHLHVVDPDDAFSRVVDGVIRELRLPGLRVTIEYTPDDVAEHLNARRTYYSCARFLQLPRWLRVDALPVVLLDMDAVVEQPLDALAALADGCDVAVLKREPPDSPWLDIVANHFVITPSAAAVRFAERVAGYIALRSTRSQLRWHLDQIALDSVLRMNELYGEPLRVVAIPPELQQRVWHIGNFYRYRLEDERFRRYARPLAG